MKLLICTQIVDIQDPILGFFHGWILEFAKHFSEVHVICLKKGTYTFPPHVHVYSLGKEDGENRLKYLVRFYWFFGKIFFRVRVDFVFFHMGAIYNILAAPFFFIRGFFGTKFYWWKAHGLINSVGKFALTFVDRVYTSTESGFPIVTKKRHVIGQAIDTNHFSPQGEVVREAYKIIFVGRITPIKRLEDFLYTVLLLRNKGIPVSASLYGPVADAAYAKRLEEIREKEGLREHVAFMGTRTQDELVSVYQHASILLNTSMTQSMDKTVLEAALCGCLPVTANVAFRELLANTGFFTEEGTPEKYADILETIMASDSDSLRRHLRERVIESHSIQTFSNRIFTS